MKKILLGILIFLGILTLYFLFYPVDIDPVAYSPPPNPGLTGPFTPNQDLNQTELLLADLGFGPEDIAMGPDSMLYTGFEDGRIVKFSPAGELLATLANTQGRPLGMKFDKAGNLIIADEYKGLLSMDVLGNITVLTDEVAGKKIFFADDLDIAQNGIIYFSEASQRHHADEIEEEFWELQPTGRLLSYDPQTKKTQVELSGLRFANGIAIGPEDAYLLITETIGTQIMKYWLQGPKKGQAEVFFNELPGFPDNIKYNEAGVFWIALPNQRIPALEDLYEKPGLRKIIKRLPNFIVEAQAPDNYGMVIGIDTLGKVVHNFQAPTGHIHQVTSALQVGNTLYLGNIGLRAVGRLRLDGGRKRMTDDG